MRWRPGSGIGKSCGESADRLAVPAAILKENQTGHEKNLEFTARQIFQQVGVPGHKADSEDAPQGRLSDRRSKAEGTALLSGFDAKEI